MLATTLAEIVERAETGWPLDTVPYSQAAVWNDDDGRTDEDGYRRDCSGYASMAMGLPPWGLSTVTLVSSGAVKRIEWAQLQAGHLVGRMGPGTGGNAGHVMVVVAVDHARGRYTVLEQSGGRGPDRNTYRIGDGQGRNYQPYASTHVTGGIDMFAKVKLGDRGGAVVVWQWLLIALGGKPDMNAAGQPSGVYGQATKQAVVAVGATAWAGPIRDGSEIGEWEAAAIMVNLGKLGAQRDGIGVGDRVTIAGVVTEVGEGK